MTRRFPLVDVLRAQRARPGVRLRQPEDVASTRSAEPTDTARDPQRGAPTSSTLSTGAFTFCCHSTAYGRRVSGATEDRAAVFTTRPQAVEVYQAGAWWSGELLGWRHDADGSCQVWVRVVLGGIEESAWTDLASLRLPERHLSVAPPSAASSPYAPATQEMSLSRHPAGRRVAATSGVPSATAGLSMVRDFSVVPNGSPAVRTGGRRRAPDETAAPSGGRRRAPEVVAPGSVPGGRRRAPEAAPASAASTTASGPAPAAALGRHRAPVADAGRHRTADTGLFSRVAEGAPASTSARHRPAPQASVTHPAPPPSAQPARSPGSARSRARDSWTAPDGLESELLTRPMRLSDLAPHAGRPRVDGSRRTV